MKSYNQIVAQCERLSLSAFGSPLGEFEFPDAIRLLRLIMLIKNIYLSNIIRHFRHTKLPFSQWQSMPLHRDVYAL